MILPVLALAGALQVQPRPVDGLDPRLMRPGGIDAALAEYDRLCLADPFDRAAHVAAVRRSSWRFRPAPNPPEGALTHQAVRGFAFFRDTGRLPQCNLDTATDRAVASPLIVARIEAMLAGRLGAVPARRVTATAIFWQWPGEPDKSVRLYLLRRTGDDPRQLSLTLQKWPATLARDGVAAQETRP